METTVNKNNGAIFPLGERAPVENFTGTVHVHVVAPRTEALQYSVGSVTFEQGARSNWHTHPSGQTLIVINGDGLYQERGMAVMKIGRGDTVVCPPATDHWHGAAPGSRMTHIAITTDTGSGDVNWLEAVTDEEYMSGE